METNFKLKHCNLRAIYLVIGLSVSSIFCTIAQVSDSTHLRINNVQLSDTVDVGEFLTLNTYFVNESSRIFSTDLSIYYDFEVYVSEQYDNEYDEVQGVQNVIIQPGDSILISKEIEITEAKFTSNSTNIIIIWPEIAGLRQVSNQKKCVYVEIYVNNSYVDNQIDLFEEVDTEEEVQIEVDDNDSEDTEDVDEFDDGSNNKGEIVKSKFKSDNNNLQQFVYTKDRNYITIYNVNERIEEVEGFIFNIDGRLINQISTNTDFPIKISNYNQPVIIQLNARSKNDPENIKTILKLF